MALNTLTTCRDVDFKGRKRGMFDMGFCVNSFHGVTPGRKTPFGNNGADPAGCFLLSLRAVSSRGEKSSHRPAGELPQMNKYLPLAGI